MNALPIFIGLEDSLLSAARILAVVIALTATAIFRWRGGPRGVRRLGLGVALLLLPQPVITPSYDVGDVCLAARGTRAWTDADVTEHGADYTIVFTTPRNAEATVSLVIACAAYWLVISGLRTCLNATGFGLTRGAPACHACGYPLQAGSLRCSECGASSCIVETVTLAAGARESREADRARE